MLKYDLHIHSCLSPCADEDMTPNNIAGMAFLAGLNVAAVCDHNSADNAKAVKKACENYGIKYIWGAEICSSEEIHILCYFKEENQLSAFCKIVEDSSFKFPNDTSVYGTQYIMDEEDNITGQKDWLLINACGLSCYEVINLCREHKGVSFWAHIDKQSFSVISVLGAIPPDIKADGVEIYNLNNRPQLIQKGFITSDTPYMSNSDAHSLEFIGAKENYLPNNHPLLKLIG